MKSGEKVGVDELLGDLAHEIVSQLRKSDVFGNNSLCFSGGELIFALRGKLYSRGETVVSTDLHVEVGDIEPPAVAEVEATGAVHVNKGGRPKGSKNKPKEE